MTAVLEKWTLEQMPTLNYQSHRLANSVRTFSQADVLEKAIDLVITMGGDGTLCWAVSLFRGAMPPVCSFAAGSLGFLTPFPLRDWIMTLTQIFDIMHLGQPLPLLVRMRFTVTVHRESDESGSPAAEVLPYQCLNEVLIHRGVSTALSKLEVIVDGEQVTMVQGDG